jgi:hypothetical protein
MVKDIVIFHNFKDMPFQGFTNKPYVNLGLFNKDATSIIMGNFVRICSITKAFVMEGIDGYNCHKLVCGYRDVWVTRHKFWSFWKQNKSFYFLR